MLVKAWQLITILLTGWSFSIRKVLGFKQEGNLDRFEIIRVHDGFTIDLVESNPKNQIHYAILHR